MLIIRSWARVEEFTFEVGLFLDFFFLKFFYAHNVLKTNLPTNGFSAKEKKLPTVFFLLCSLEHIYSHVPTNFILPMTSSYFILYLSVFIIFSLSSSNSRKSNPFLHIQENSLIATKSFVAISFILLQ